MRLIGNDSPFVPRRDLAAGARAVLRAWAGAGVSRLRGVRTNQSGRGASIALALEAEVVLAAGALTRAMRAGLRTRVGWLLALAGLVLVGVAVRALGGGDAGFLAMPAAVIAGWLVGLPARMRSWGMGEPAPAPPSEAPSDRRTSLVKRIARDRRHRRRRARRLPRAVAGADPGLWRGRRRPAPGSTAGAHAVNQRLAGPADHPPRAARSGPSTSRWLDGRLDVAAASGNILRMVPDGSAREVFANTGGRALRLRVRRGGNLVAADAVKGLLSG